MFLLLFVFIGAATIADNPKDFKISAIGETTVEDTNVRQN